MVATASNEWADSAQRSLSEAGHRAGGARRAVVELLALKKCCVSAQEITDELRESGTKVGLASVYRALDLLYREGLVMRVDLGDGSSRYEPAMPGGDHHHHVVCDRCGEVTPFEDPSLERAIERLGEELDRAVAAHDVVLHADCRRCAARA